MTNHQDWGKIISTIVFMAILVIVMAATPFWEA